MTYPIYAICRLFLGTLYPGFQSFKAVRTKNVREYVKWMMYWIVFAIYTGIESFTDIFVSFWFPFYYEIKIVFLMWLLSPVAKGSLGSSIMYRKFVHPILMQKEEEIDKYMTKIGNQGYKTFWKYANEGFNFITKMVMQTAIKNYPEITVEAVGIDNIDELVPENEEENHQQLMTNDVTISDMSDDMMSSGPPSPVTRRRSKRINKKTTKSSTSLTARSQSRQRKKKSKTQTQD